MLFIKWFVFINNTILYLFILLYWLHFYRERRGEANKSVSPFPCYSRCSSQTLLYVYIHTHTDTCTSTIFVLNSLFLFELWAKLCIFYNFMFNPCLEILKVALNASLASLSCPSYVLFFLCGQQLMKTCRQNNKILLAILTMAFWICMTLCLQLYDWCFAEGIFSSFYVPVLSARRCYHWLPHTSKYSFTLSHSSHYQRRL